MALALRPNCESCDIDLPPEDERARICSYECTFCADCVERELRNVCPNCGGGFVPRPIRPSRQWKGSAYLGERPAGTTVKHKPVDLDEHQRFAAKLKGISPKER